MANMLLSVINKVFVSGDIPDVMSEKWFCAIPKKGDLTDRNNYRGIVLMDTVLKLITRMITIRTLNGLEKNSSLCIEQGGFRPGREVISQVIALVEVLGRLINKRKGGFLIFVDIVKAFDKVPHEALFRKLWHKGVRGKSLEFLKSEYSKSRMRVRTKYGLSSIFKQELGVHQGDPFSPVAFDIFIDDIMDKLKQHGCKVDGVVRTFVGLLFADDLVLLARNRTTAKYMVAALNEWGTQWGLTFGVKDDGSKCAILPIGDKAKRQAVGLKLELHGKVLPIVDSYIYLGCKMTSQLRPHHIREQALRRATRAFNSVKHLLGSRALPTMTRVMLLRNIVINSAMFGAELWGGVQRGCNKFQALINQGLRLCFGYSMNQYGAPTQALAMEADIPPFVVMTTCARIRLYQKIDNGEQNNWLKVLIDSPPCRGSYRGSWWVRRTMLLRQRILGRYGDSVRSDEGVDMVSVTKLREVMWRNNTHNSEAVKRMRWLHGRYDIRPWAPLREWLLLWERLGGDAFVERALWSIRNGSFWTARRLASIGFLPNRYRHHCPFCEQPTPETIDHFIFECGKWKEARMKLLRRISVIFDSSVVNDVSNRVLRVLGDHPVDLASVGLAIAKEQAVEQWEIRHVTRRGWIRARAPIWEYLVSTVNQRSRWISPLINAHHNAGSRRRYGGHPRVDAQVVGQPYIAGIDVAGIG